MHDFRAPNPAPVLAILAALAAFIVGSNLVVRPELVLPLTLEAVLLSFVTFALITREKDGEVRSWLLRLIVAAIVVRFAALIAVGYVFPPHFFALDSIGYERIGASLSNHWLGISPRPNIPGEGWLPTYYHLNAAFHFLLGDSAMGAVVLNMFAGAWTVLLTFKLGCEVLSKQVAKTAAVVTAFFPSLVLWSVLNIRDSLAGLAVILTVYFGVRAFRSPNPRNLLFLGLGLVLLTALRNYMGFLVVSGIALGVVAAIRPQRLLPTLAAGTILILFLSLLSGQLDLFPSEVMEDPLGSASRMRSALQQGAGSAFGIGREAETVGGAIRYLPVGFSFLLFAPFPWALESALQTAAAPETLLWYPLFVLALLGIGRAVRRGRYLSVIPISVLLVVTTSYALVEGNFGTAYRHRAQIMPLFFLFVGVGWYVVKPWFKGGWHSS
jgi:4-amino-4-deoxy-L-arabinose transferase-like glycosyltransferase